MTFKPSEVPTTTSITSACAGFPITAADADLSIYTRGISIGGAGTLVLTFLNDTVQTVPSGALAVGVIHQIAAKRVAAASTATQIWGWY